MKKTILFLTLIFIFMLVGCKTPYQQMQEQGKIEPTEIWEDIEVEKLETTAKKENACEFVNTLTCRVLELGTKEVLLEIYNGGTNIIGVGPEGCTIGGGTINSKEKKVLNFKKCNFGRIGDYVTRKVTAYYQVQTKYGYNTTILIYGNLSGTITSESIPQEFMFLSSNPGLIRGGSEYKESFEIDENTYSIISNNQYEITFSLETLAVLESVSFKIYLNGDEYQLDSYNTYIDISNSIQKGTNEIRLVPEKDLRVTNMEIRGDIV